MSEKQSADETIEAMKHEAGLKTDAELAQFLGISQSSVSAWRRRGSVPKRYEIRIARRADEFADVPKGGQSWHLAEAYAYSLVGIAARKLEARVLYGSQDRTDVWIGFRLARLHSYVSKFLEEPISQIEANENDKDILLQRYQLLKEQIESEHLMEWLETIPDRRI